MVMAPLGRPRFFAFFRGDFVLVFESYPSIHSVFCPCHLEILHVDAPKVL